MQQWNLWYGQLIKICLQNNITYQKNILNISRNLAVWHPEQCQQFLCQGAVFMLRLGTEIPSSQAIMPGILVLWSPHRTMLRGAWSIMGCISWSFLTTHCGHCACVGGGNGICLPSSEADLSAPNLMGPNPNSASAEPNNARPFDLETFLL